MRRFFTYDAVRYHQRSAADAERLQGADGAAHTADARAGVVAIRCELGLGHAGWLFDQAVNDTAAMVAAAVFVLTSGKREALVCDGRGLLYFIGGGIAENAGVFLVFVALGYGEVSVVTPLSGTALFSRSS
jgi:uncharacterized membrane protein